MVLKTNYIRKTCKIISFVRFYSANFAAEKSGCISPPIIEI